MYSQFTRGSNRSHEGNKRNKRVPARPPRTRTPETGPNVIESETAMFNYKSNIPKHAPSVRGMSQYMSNVQFRPLNNSFTVLTTDTRKQIYNLIQYSNHYTETNYLK